MTGLHPAERNRPTPAATPPAGLTAPLPCIDAATGVLPRAVPTSGAPPETLRNTYPTIASEALRRAREFLKVGLLSNAIEALLTLRRKSGDTAALRQSLGEACWNRRDKVAAAEHYGIAVDLAGDEASEFLMSAYARSLRALGRLEEAREAYERAIRSRNSSGGRAYGEDIYLGLSQTFQAMGQADKADVTRGLWVEQAYLDDHGTRVVYCPIAKNASTFLKTALVLNSAKAQQFVQSGKDAHVFTRTPRSGFHLGNRCLLGNRRYLSFAVLRAGGTCEVALRRRAAGRWQTLRLRGAGRSRSFGLAANAGSPLRAAEIARHVHGRAAPADRGTVRARFRFVRPSLRHLVARPGPE